MGTPRQSKCRLTLARVLPRMHSTCFHLFSSDACICIEDGVMTDIDDDKLHQSHVDRSRRTCCRELLRPIHVVRHDWDLSSRLFDGPQLGGRRERAVDSGPSGSTGCSRRPTCSSRRSACRSRRSSGRCSSGGRCSSASRSCSTCSWRRRRQFQASLHLADGQYQIRTDAAATTHEDYGEGRQPSPSDEFLCHRHDVS